MKLNGLRTNVSNLNGQVGEFALENGLRLVSLLFGNVLGDLVAVHRLLSVLDHTVHS